MSPDLTVLVGDALGKLRELPSESVHCCVTSPPYWGLRDYGTAEWEGGDSACDHFKLAGGTAAQNLGKSELAQRANVERSSVPFLESCGKCGAKRIDSQLGLEKTPEEYVAKMLEVFREVWRVLRSDGTCWINLGDSYWNGGSEKRDGGHGFVDGGKPKLKLAEGSLLQAKSSTNLGLKPKDIVGIPWRVAFALQADGWYLRSDIIWSKPNPMPESVTDRPTKAHEYLFLLTKSPRYFYDSEAIKEGQAESQIGRTRNDIIGGTSWKERQQHGRGGEYKTTTGSRENGGEMALFGECGEGSGQNGISREAVRKGPEMARQNESPFVESVRRESVLLSRNKRSVWTVSTAPYPEAHFATYPPDLIKPCILAGTSAKGCCAKCGSPWERVVEAIGAVKNQDYGNEPRSAVQQGGLSSTTLNGKPPQIKTIGWQPTCECEGKDFGIPELDRLEQCTVLDPFAGSGTTGAVALELGRSAILIELSPNYAQLIRERCAITPGLALS